MEKKVERSNSIEKHYQSQTPDWDYIQSQFTKSIREYCTMTKDLDYNDTIITLIRELARPRLVKAMQPSIQKEVNANDTIPKIEEREKVEPDQYFLPKGMLSTVPKYLQYSQLTSTKNKVLNRKLSKANVLMLIKDIWQAKLLYEANNPKVSIAVTQTNKAAEFLYLYLKKRFGNQDQICEWGYNLTEACQKYRDSSVDCALFTDILNGTSC